MITTRYHKSERLVYIMIYVYCILLIKDWKVYWYPLAPVKFPWVFPWSYQQGSLSFPKKNAHFQPPSSHLSTPGPSLFCWRSLFLSETFRVHTGPRILAALPSRDPRGMDLIIREMRQLREPMSFGGANDPPNDLHPSIYRLCLDKENHGKSSSNKNMPKLRGL